MASEEGLRKMAEEINRATSANPDAVHRRYEESPKVAEQMRRMAGAAQLAQQAMLESLDAQRRAGNPYYVGTVPARVISTRRSKAKAARKANKKRRKG